MSQGLHFKKIVEETKKAKNSGYDWKEFANGRTIEELVIDNLAEFYIQVMKNSCCDEATGSIYG